MSKTPDYYTDPRGDKIPARHVRPYDRKRDRSARRIVAKCEDLQSRMIKTKADILDIIADLQSAAAADAGVNDLGGKGGNIQFRSYDGTITVSIDNQRRTEFDERITFAERLIGEAIAEMRAAVAPGESTALQAIEDLATLATAAFTPRGSGTLDKQRVRDLRNLDVKHPKFRQAQEIIGKCERTIGHRQYFRVTVRRSPDGKREPIVLDIAAL